jgi:hypothetical protein
MRLSRTERPVHLITAGAIVECVLAHRLRGISQADLKALLLAPSVADGVWVREALQRFPVLSAA